jgi:hypothetical protein
MAFRPLALAATSTFAVLALVAGCSDDPADPPAPGAGGSSTGGVGTGGATGGVVTNTGGAPTGGAPAATGGVSTGGASTGGASTGGASTGGVAPSGGSGGGVAGGGAGGKGGSGGAAGGAGGTSGGGSGGSGGSSIPASFATMKLIIESLCQGCHGSDMSMNLNTDPALYGRLTTGMTKACGPVITKGDPSKSALFKMLEGTCPPPFSVMPDGCKPSDGNCLQADYLDAVKRWIAAGAPEN